MIETVHVVDLVEILNNTKNYVERLTFDTWSAPVYIKKYSMLFTLDSNPFVCVFSI